MASGHGKRVTARSRPAPHPGRGVLFASSSARPAAYSLTRALAAADLSGARLHLLRVLPRASQLSALLSPFLQNDNLQQVTDFIAAARSSANWYGAVLGDRYVEEHALLRIGSFAEEVGQQAQALRVGMIVVPAGEWPGEQITRLARTTQLPVLVVREVSNPQSVIAATDFGVGRVSIVERADELGVQLNAGVVELHNVSPSVWRAALALDAENANALPSRTRTSVVTRHASHAQSILSEARARQADTVVVGTHTRSTVAQLVRLSVAVQVVDGAGGSVLVVPVRKNDSRGARER